ncbi:hypothetical protein [Raoultella ornithinolytica]|uniref:hypothetical protein n=1 Tax=Raoultella ornithinolytica TaxID=54291 RepID=UPI0015DD1F72|nr:hypothetical protein [Raoultella ornithinolytica]BBQ90346.1 hypothetical protein WP3W18E06_34740 [Raoultella ornithinolytica]
MARFKPFIGENYYKSAYGVRVLILGESHYGDQEDEAEDFTQMVVKDNAYTPGSPFFSRVTKLLMLSEEYPTDTERYEAWQQVSFYNFVQEFVGRQGRIRPTPQMWKDAMPMFIEVARGLKPDVIVVLGYDLWNKAPELPGDLPVEWCSIKHPAGGMSYNESFVAFTESLEKARSRAALTRI